MRNLITFFILNLLCQSLTVNADELKVTFLGTGTPVPSIERFGSSTLIEHKGKYFLFDVGRGATIRLSQIGMYPSDIDNVFLTHLHSDHITGFDDFWITGGIWQRANTLNVYGPDGTKSFVEHTQAAFSLDAFYREKQSSLNLKGLEVNVTEIKEGLIYDEDGLKVTAFRVDHGAVEHAYGYRIDSDRHSVLLSGDTTHSENLIANSRELDLLIHEVSVIEPKLLQSNPKLKSISKYHTSLQQLHKLVEKVNPNKTVLNHLLLIGADETELSHLLETQFQDQSIDVGQDLMTIHLR